MRVISGFLKNRPIVVPKNAAIRPTSSKLRSAVFNICQGSLEGANVLDLFCGSGAIGIEAISRGASHCTFLDQDASALVCLRKMLTDFGIIARSTIIQKEALRFLRNSAPQETPYTLVYIDPPYNLVEPLCDILCLVKENLSLTPESDIFLEVRKGSFTPSDRIPLSFISKRTYSESDLWHYGLP